MAGCSPPFSRLLTLRCALGLRQATLSPGPGRVPCSSGCPPSGFSRPLRSLFFSQVNNLGPTEQKKGDSLLRLNSSLGMSFRILSLYCWKLISSHTPALSHRLVSQSASERPLLPLVRRDSQRCDFFFFLFWKNGRHKGGKDWESGWSNSFQDGFLFETQIWSPFSTRHNVHTHRDKVGFSTEDKGLLL